MARLAFEEPQKRLRNGHDDNYTRRLRVVYAAGGQ